MSWRGFGSDLETQERQAKDLVGFIAPWRFESSLRHQHPIRLQRHRVVSRPVPTGFSSASSASSVVGIRLFGRGVHPDAPSGILMHGVGTGSGHPEGTPGDTSTRYREPHIMPVMGGLEGTHDAGCGGRVSSE